jgi:hypothetical protein
MHMAKQQTYKGNGNHGWEPVCSDSEADKGFAASDITDRLRVPGGWLYRTNQTLIIGDQQSVANALVFVPLPAVLVQGKGEASKGKHAL